jgi:hypothetical protein
LAAATIVIVAFLPVLAFAVDHVVGGDVGWTLNYAIGWPEGKTFKVGDNLGTENRTSSCFFHKSCCIHNKFFMPSISDVQCTLRRYIHKSLLRVVCYGRCYPKPLSARPAQDASFSSLTLCLTRMPAHPPPLWHRLPPCRPPTAEAAVEILLQPELSPVEHPDSPPPLN